jgi:hypothetical protein
LLGGLANRVFCDLFAAFTVGSAYGWGHFHLHVGCGGDPFLVPKRSPTEHPADAARMDVILRALRRVSFSQDATAIQSHWQQLLSTIRASETAEYRRCFPETLLEMIVDKAHQGVQALGCQLAQPGMQEPIRKLPNDAWAEFWQAPAGYAAWEKREADKLGKLLGVIDEKQQDIHRPAESGKHHEQHRRADQIEEDQTASTCTTRPRVNVIDG